jgi:uncharacterized protein involved in high-affinity Fe2+ transport
VSFRFIRPALLPLLTLCAALSAPSSAATEFKLQNKANERIVHNSMTIEGGYIQPIILEDGRENLPREQSDAYFIAHIKAASANPHGYSKFAWIPYLDVSYTLEKTDPGSQWIQQGTLSPALAKFGPHYGANVKLDGVGKYRYTVHVAPPEKGKGINRLIDRENGVTWWEPFEVSWNFTYLGLGKKGVIGAKGGY